MVAPLIRPRAWVAVIAGIVLSLFLAAPPLRSQAGPTLVAQVPHLGRIHAMAYSPDGRTLATAGSDRTVKLWEADRGLLIRTFEGHAGEVRSAVFSADGTRLLSASDDGTVRVWDVATGRTVTTLSGDRQGAMSGAAFGEGDTVIAAQTAEFAPGTPERLNELAVWNLASGTRVRRARTNGFCWAPAFTADRSLALCQSGELWDVATLTRLPTPWTNVSHAAFSPNGSLLAIGPGFRLEIWDVKRLSRVHSVDLGGFATESLAFAPDGRTVAVGGNRGEVALWDAITGNRVSTPSPPVAFDFVTALAFSPDGRTLLSTTTRRTVVTTMAARSVVAGGLADARDFHPSAIAAGLEPVGDATGARPSAVVAPSRLAVPVTAVRFSPDGRLLAAGGGDTAIRLWNLQSGQLTRVLRGQPRAPEAIVFSADGRSMVSTSQTGGSDGMLWWDLQADAPVRVFDDGRVNHVALHPDGRTLLGGRSVLQSWDTSSSDVRRRYSLSCAFLALSPDGTTIACTRDRNATNRAALVLAGRRIRKRASRARQSRRRDHRRLLQPRWQSSRLGEHRPSSHAVGCPARAPPGDTAGPLRRRAVGSVQPIRIRDCLCRRRWRDQAVGRQRSASPDADGSQQRRARIGVRPGRDDPRVGQRRWHVANLVC